MSWMNHFVGRIRRSSAILPSVAVAAALAAVLVGGCKPTGPAPAAKGSAQPKSASTATPSVPSAVPSSPSLCDQIIDINTSAGYMVNKAYAPGGPTAGQLEKIVNLVLLREKDLAAAAKAAGMSDDYHVVLGFYHAMAGAAAGDPGFYADYLARKPAAVQRITSAIDPSFPAKQKVLAAYQKQTCGISFPSK